jgi:hypothetical protein
LAVPTPLHVARADRLEQRQAIVGHDVIAGQ